MNSVAFESLEKVLIPYVIAGSFHQQVIPVVLDDYPPKEWFDKAQLIKFFEDHGYSIKNINVFCRGNPDVQIVEFRFTLA